MNNSDFLRSAIKLRGFIDIDVVGSSMSPSLLSGDRVRLIPPITMSIGCLAVFPGRRSGQPILHRLIDARHDGFDVVGDGATVLTSERIENSIGIVKSLWHPQKGFWVDIPLDEESFAIATLSKRIIENKEALTGDPVRDGVNDSLLLARRDICRKWRVALLGS
jgi:hypothetical protein